MNRSRSCSRSAETAAHPHLCREASAKSSLGHKTHSKLWSTHEDKVLCATVSCYGDDRVDWHSVELEVQKPAKSCRLRWENQLKPDIDHSLFRPEEDQIVLHMQHEEGNKWSQIAHVLTQAAQKRLQESGLLSSHPMTPYRRTDNQVKNRWHSTLEKEANGTSQAAFNRKDFLGSLAAVGLDGQPIISLARGDVVLGIIKNGRWEDFVRAEDLASLPDSPMNRAVSNNSDAEAMDSSQWTSQSSQPALLGPPLHQPLHCNTGETIQWPPDAALLTQYCQLPPLDMPEQYGELAPPSSGWQALPDLHADGQMRDLLCQQQHSNWQSLIDGESCTGARPSLYAADYSIYGPRLSEYNLPQSNLPIGSEEAPEAVVFRAMSQITERQQMENDSPQSCTTPHIAGDYSSVWAKYTEQIMAPHLPPPLVDVTQCPAIGQEILEGGLSAYSRLAD